VDASQTAPDHGSDDRCGYEHGGIAGLRTIDDVPHAAPGFRSRRAEGIIGATRGNGKLSRQQCGPNRVPEVVAKLRKRYPSVSNAEVDNYLVAAYCPEVAKLNGLTEGEQTARVQLFSHQVETAIHID
jgi:hypothetical protein